MYYSPSTRYPPGTLAIIIPLVMQVLNVSLVIPDSVAVRSRCYQWFPVLKGSPLEPSPHNYEVPLYYPPSEGMAQGSFLFYVHLLTGPPQRKDVPPLLTQDWTCPSWRLFASPHKQ